MKISLKFFCTAYVMVLFVSSLTGAFLVRNASNMLWEQRVETVTAAAQYAADSFLSFAQTSAQPMEGAWQQTIQAQIQNVLDESVSSFWIEPEEEGDARSQNLQDNEGMYFFTGQGETRMMEAVCRVRMGTDRFLIHVTSDFSQTQAYTMKLWWSFSAAVCLFSLGSGLCLFFLSRRMVSPLQTLMKTAQDIAAGDYGKTVPTKSHDEEIRHLAESFNTMSVTVREKMDEIKREGEKRDRFVSSFSHEIKTPMTAIMGYAQMLHGYDLTEDEKKEAAGAIYQEARRLEKLSRQLLTLYVYENERIDMEPVRLTDLQQGLSATIAALSRRYQVTITTMWSSAIVIANEELLISLLINLMDNACKATEKGGQIQIGCDEGDERVTLWVQDNGRGIPKEHIPYLTEAFYREDKARSRALGGAGLGLSLCEKIARLHKTRLQFESEEGKGTRVFFSLQKEEKTDED